MKMSKCILVVLGLLFSSIANAQNSSTSLTQQAGASANYNGTITFPVTPHSPSLGLPITQGGGPPPLINQQEPPGYLQFNMLFKQLADFGDIVIGNSDDFTPVVVKGDSSTVVFAPLAPFTKYRRTTNGPSSGLKAVLVAKKFVGAVNLLGVVYVSSLEGIPLLPSGAGQDVRNVIAEAADPNLAEIYLIPIPDGFKKSVGVRGTSNSFGFNGVLSKILSSVFGGIGPSFQSTDGTAMPTGTWSQLYAVLERSSDGVQFSFNLQTPEDTQLAQAPTPPPAEEASSTLDDETRKRAIMFAKNNYRVTKKR